MRFAIITAAAALVGVPALAQTTGGATSGSAVTAGTPRGGTTTVGEAIPDGTMQSAPPTASRPSTGGDTMAGSGAGTATDGGAVRDPATTNGAARGERRRPHA